MNIDDFAQLKTSVCTSLPHVHTIPSKTREASTALKRTTDDKSPIRSST
jgi:hypothetical protein